MRQLGRALDLLQRTGPRASDRVAFLAVSGDAFTYPEFAAFLRAALGEAARRVPKRTLPDWVVRLAAPFSAEVRYLAFELGERRSASHEKATRVLGWTPRSREEAVLASARSLIELGLVTP